MNDATLQSDYHFLEDVVDQMERGRRRTLGSGGGTSKRPPPKRARRPWEVGGGKSANQQEDALPPHPLLQAAAQQQEQSSTVLLTTSSILKLPNDLAPRLRKVAQTVATTGNTRILFGPAALQRRLLNKSYVHRDSNVVHWTVEWIVYEEENRDVSSAKSPSSPHRLYTMVPATTTLTQALSEASLLPSSPSSSSSFTDPVLLIRQFPQTTYAQLPLSNDVTLQQALSGRMVMEFPTLHIVPSSRVSEFQLTVQEVGKVLQDNDDDAETTNETTPKSSGTSAVAVGE
jgi:hypothetical protein